MSSELHLLVNVAVAVAVALVGGMLAHALRQPVIVGYLLAGIAIGPFTPGFIGDRDQIAALAEVGVIFLMFALGIEFSLGELARVRGIALVGTTLQVVLSIAAGLGLGAIVGWPFGQALFFGERSRSRAPWWSSRPCRSAARSGRSTARCCSGCSSCRTWPRSS
jgi:monovalent cation:H+ antiporter-2, CPA2 family